MGGSRKQIAVETRRRLLIQSGYRCIVPHCQHESGLDIHHIDSNPQNNDENNLIVLCAVHHRMATEGKIDRQACLQMKNSLIPISEKGIVLHTRREYFETAIRLFSQSNTYRAIAAGPFLLRPDWYMKRRDKAIQLPNYDKKLFLFVKSKCRNKRNHSIRFIFRNTERFKEKINKFVEPNERNKFIDDVLANIEIIWGKDGTQGPDLICHDTGFLRIDLIYDTAIIEANRTTPSNPISSGIIYKDQNSIQTAVDRYDNVFDNLSRGHDIELNSLENYIKLLW